VAEEAPVAPAYAPDPVPPLHRSPLSHAVAGDEPELVNPIARAMAAPPEHVPVSPPPFPQHTHAAEVGRVEAVTETSSGDSGGRARSCGVERRGSPATGDVAA
jgi:hypothetical protein